ncbi:MAG: ATP-binding cassette domain-containing protein [bacterium]|nr:ATP-binding cassette domain-containing protein [bacterium]
MSFINLQEVSISFGGPPLLEGVNLRIQRGEHACLLGRNGTGKTTLMKLVNGDIEPDKGTVARKQGLTTALLTQEVPEDISGNVFDVVLGGLGKRGELPTQYHHLTVRLAEEGGDDLLKQLDLVQKELETGDGWEIHRQADTIITRMKLDEEVEFKTLSAGMKRRVLLARALVCKPDILLLDEPTNHLDIDAITWLEEFLNKYEGTILFVTHDRMLVRKLSTRIIEIDRGGLTSWDCNYETYLERKEAFLDAEKVRRHVFDRKLAKEEEWIRQGIKARRTRNEGRVTALLKMREERRNRREVSGTVNMRLHETKRSGKLVIEAEEIGFGYDEQDIIRDFSTLIMRGDRVGIIGPNGSGKTTLLRVLLGELQPRKGGFKLGANLEVTYFDQLRGQLDEELSVQDNVADGNDRILIGDNTRHVISYLQDFLFTPDRARSAVKVLSGGERNRLLLAKLFAKPTNVLVMDEPTNDLDVETLELLEELLAEYSGTLLLVSHDRAFINNVVTSTLVLEGEGKVTEYFGGYDDWLRQRPESIDQKETDKKEKPLKKAPKNPQARQVKRKLTNKERQQLESLPAEIEKMEEQQEQLYADMADPGFYKQDGQTIAEAGDKLETLKKKLAQSYHRWEELENIV